MGYQYHPDDMHIFRAVAATKAKGVSMTPEEILRCDQLLDRLRELDEQVERAREARVALERRMVEQQRRLGSRNRRA